MTIVPYADEAYAIAYFAQRLGTDAFDAGSSTNRVKGLKQATLLIDTLNFIGSKTDQAQANEFPRNGDTLVPEEVKQACCEQALALLLGQSLEAGVAARRLASVSVGDASESYRDGIDGLGENAGLTSATAGRLLMPWLSSPREIILERVG
jgi:hypothetical protein